MLELLIDFAVHRRVAMLVFSAAFLVFGIVTFRKLKIEAFPDVTNVQVMVITLYPGQAAEEVEKKVTIPVERALVGVPRVLIQRSDNVVRPLAGGADVRGRRRHLLRAPAGRGASVGGRRALRRHPPPRPNDTPVGQVYQYTLESDSHGPSELRSWQDWVVSKHLMRVAGVADVVSFGGFQKEFHVIADPAKLRSNGVTLAELTDAVAHSNGATSGGYLPNGESELVNPGPRLPARASRHREHRDRGAQRHPCAGAQRRHRRGVVHAAPRGGGARRGHRLDRGHHPPPPGREPKDVLEGVHEAFARINREILPPGMRIVPFYDRTHLVDRTLRTVSHNVLEGVLLVSLGLWLFLRALSGSIAVAVTMPLALMTAFVGLYYAGVPANLLSMGAIDFGILLDGAVILVENATRHLSEERPPPEEVAHVVGRAAKEVVRPTLFSMAIIGAAMMPIFTLERVEGRIFRPVALTYASPCSARCSSP